MKKKLKISLVFFFCCYLFVATFNGMFFTANASEILKEEETSEVPEDEKLEEENPEEENPVEEEETEIKVLMVGNSFTKRKALPYSVGTILQEVAEVNKKKISVTTVIHGGAHLSYYAFWTEPYKLYFEELLAALQQEQYDYIILQEQTKSAIEKYENEMLPAVKQICTYIQSYQDHAKVMLYETAPYVDGTTTDIGGQKSVLTLQEFQERALYGYIRLQQATEVERIPVGTKIYYSTKIYPEIQTVSEDLRHPNYTGYYMAAMEIYYKIYGEIPVVTSETLKDSEIDETQISLLNQLIGEKVVLNKTELQLKVGQSDSLWGEIVTAEDRRGTLSWKSLHPEIAIVDKKSGQVTGIAEGTTAVLAETTNGLMSVSLVTVENKLIPQLSFGQENYYVATGDTIRLSPKMENWKADDTLKWSTSNSAIAVVAPDGTVTTKKMGKVVIKVRSSKDKTISATYNLYVAGKAPIGLTATITKKKEAGSAVELNWKPVYGVKKYRIYRSEKKNRNYVFVGTATTNSYMDMKVEENKKYYYKVTATAGSLNTESPLSSYAKVVVLGTVQNQKKAITGKYIKLEWNRNKYASGYEIYRSEKRNSGYEKIKTISDNKRTYYKDKKIEKDKIYYYKIRAYKDISGERVYSVDSNIVKGQLLKPVEDVVVKATNKHMKLTWENNSSATGYEIYRSEERNGVYEKIETIYKNKITRYLDKNVVPGKTYYYKVKARIKVAGKIFYSEDSAIKKGKIPEE